MRGGFIRVARAGSRFDARVTRRLFAFNGQIKLSAAPSKSDEYNGKDEYILDHGFSQKMRVTRNAKIQAMPVEYTT